MCILTYRILALLFAVYKVVRSYLEPRFETLFIPNSYGYPTQQECTSGAGTSERKCQKIRLGLAEAPFIFMVLPCGSVAVICNFCYSIPITETHFLTEFFKKKHQIFYHCLLACKYEIRISTFNCSFSATFLAP